MKRFINKKVVAIGMAAGLVLGGAGAAFAYFTSTGSGTGSATVGASGALSVSGSTTGSLYPGESPAPSNNESFTVTNNNNGAELLNSITLVGVKACSSGSTWTGSQATGGCNNSGTEKTTCESFSGAAANPGGVSNGSGVDYWMAPITSIGQDVASNASNVTVTSTGTLIMNDNGNQDACQNASLALFFTTG